MDVYNFVCVLGIFVASVIRMYFQSLASKRQVEQPNVSLSFFKKKKKLFVYLFIYLNVIINLNYRKIK